jgi:hypothetical protein
MQKSVLWQEILRQNPDWDGPEILKISPKGIKKLFELAYDQGHSAGFENGKASAGKTAANESSPFDKVFGDAFGKAFGKKGH